MHKKYSFLVLAFISLVGAHFFYPQRVFGAEALLVGSPFLYRFGIADELGESSTDLTSTSPYWWVNSGAGMTISAGRGHTLQGSLPSNDYWRNLYARNNPTDTDNGYHPQNIFRLVGRSLWQDLRQEAYFKVNNDNLSDSSNRNSSNGLLFFNRYKDSDNLYYAGVRVDGYAVIKKKVNGTYHTLAYSRVFSGSYNRSSNPNLLPKNAWIGLRSEVKDNADGSVSIKLYMDKNWNNNWVLIAEALDNGKTNGPVVSGRGYGGIRTDFMDVTFDHYKIENL